MRKLLFIGVLIVPFALAAEDPARTQAPSLKRRLSDISMLGSFLDYGAHSEKQVIKAVRKKIVLNPDWLAGITYSQLELAHSATVDSADGYSQTIYLTYIQKYEALEIEGSIVNFTVKVFPEKAVIMSAYANVYPSFEMPPAGEVFRYEKNVIRDEGARVLGLDATEHRMKSVKRKLRFHEGKWCRVSEFTYEGSEFRGVVDEDTGEAWIESDRLYQGVSGLVQGRGILFDPHGTGENLVTLNLESLVVTTANSNSTSTDVNGRFSFPSETAPVTVGAALVGEWSTVVTQRSTDQNLTLSELGIPDVPLNLRFNPSLADEFDTAQVTAYYHTTFIHDWINDRISPAVIPGIEISIPTNVNVPGTCNAFYTLATPTLNFFTKQSDAGCPNMAYDTVVYHEYGHFADHQAGGITNFGLSEGWGDLLAVYATGQPDIGEGFFGPGTVLRSGDNAYQYRPTDEVHALGQAWAGFGWHLRENLLNSAEFAGDTAGAIAKSESIVIPTLLANAVDIPDAVLQAAILDDDDGDLTNGTAHLDLIEAAAAQHGIPFEFDFVAPDPVIDLTATADGFSRLLLNFTSSGDNGAEGTATSYDIRLSLAAIVTDVDFAAATPISTGVIRPQPPGLPEEVLVTGLQPNTTYFFAMKVIDDQGNLSSLSNSSLAATNEFVRLAPHVDLQAQSNGIASIALSWSSTANTPQETGHSLSYDIRYSTSAVLTDADFESATPVAGAVPAPSSPGQLQQMIVSGLAPNTRYFFVMKVLDNLGHFSDLSNLVGPVSMATAAAIFEEDFESGIGGWTISVIALWHLQQNADRAGSFDHSMAYNVEGRIPPNYNTMNPHSGSMTSPVIDLSGVSSGEIVMLFHQWWESESVADVDRQLVQISVDGAPFTDIHQVLGENSQTSTKETVTVDLTSFRGSMIQIRFHFDSVTQFQNHLEGWYVDDVVIVAGADVTNTPPIADAGGAYFGNEDLQVPFNGSGSADPDSSGPLTYLWNFGDGTTGMGVSPTHTYTNGGIYEVSLIVNDGIQNSLPSMTTADITQINEPPVANAGPERDRRVFDLIKFDGSGSSDEEDGVAGLLYSWDFGDGNVGAGVNAEHFYSQAGNFLVMLTVIDSGGLTHSDSANVNVSVAPNADTVSITKAEFRAEKGEFRLEATSSAGGTATLTAFGFGTMAYDSAENTYSITRTRGQSPSSVTVQSSLGGGDTINLTGGNTVPAADAGGPYSGNVNANVLINGAGSFDPDGDPLNYTWNFGDGETGTGSFVLHSYRTAGIHTVTLVVNDGIANSAPSETTVDITGGNGAPAADAGGPYSGNANAAVLFDGLGSSDPDGDPLNYTWDFGDGSTGTGVSPSHTYADGGIYAVTLVVNDGMRNSPSDVTSADINAGPTANAGPDQSGQLNNIFVFDGSGSSDNEDGPAGLTYNWNFGDGNFDTGVNASHAYTGIGNFVVTLTVTDTRGSMASDTANVNVATPPEITTPAPLSTLTSATETFRWVDNATPVTEWSLFIGSSVGGSEHFNSGSLGTNLEVTVSTLPTDGSRLHVRLSYRVAGDWFSRDFQYTAANIVPQIPTITDPAPGETLSGATATFRWTPNGTAASEWWLFVGSSVGGAEHFNSGSLGTSLEAAVPALPTDGSQVHVRLWYRVFGDWLSVDFQYTAADIAPQTPVITDPAPGGTLGGSSATFRWTPNGTAVTEWWLYVGQTAGGSQFFDSGSLGESLQVTADALPVDGSTVHVRLWFRVAGAWQSEDFQYVAALLQPTIVSPAPGTTLTGSSVVMRWSANGTAVTEWWLYAGSSVGASDYFDSGTLGIDPQATVIGLPSDGTTVHVRLWFRVAELWQSADFQYNATGP